MNDNEYRQESIKYNRSLRDGRFDDAINSLLVMERLNSEKDMPNDAMRCVVIALCLELTQKRRRPSLRPEIIDRIGEIAKSPKFDYEWMKRLMEEQISRSFVWYGPATLAEALDIFELCVQGRSKEAKRFVSKIGRKSFFR